MNKIYADICYTSFKEISSEYQLVITLPNTDTYGTFLRDTFFKLEKDIPERIKIIENFGTQGYFSAMKLSKFILGNSSSGIIEAASLNKYVINLGERQKGRLTSNNVFHCDFNTNQIIETINKVKTLGDYLGENIYFHGGASEKIIDILKNT
jgi:GDP/UDP-N,N'-diacetylbacillosamine 2-epimerase (hydrolysing)